MKKTAIVALASLALFGTAACSRSDSPEAQASADNAEMPADEAMNSVEASAQPVPDEGTAEEKAAPKKEAPAAAATEAAGKTATSVQDAAAQTARDFEAAGADEPADKAAPADKTN